MKKASPLRRLAFSLIPALIFFALLEVCLRATGFHYQRSRSYMTFNFPNPNELHNIFQPDPELLWRLRPGYVLGEGFAPLNSRGFRGDESSPKKPGLFRLACVGDSVIFGRPGADLAALIEEASSSSLEAMNFGVPGYSSWQGKKLLPRILEEYKPDAALIMFGWNDHWLAKGFADKDQIVTESIAADALDPIRGLRVYQLLHKTSDKLRQTKKNAPATLRVSREDYKENLVAMADLARGAGAIPIFAVPPSAIGVDKVPDYLTYLEFIKKQEDLAKIHGQYSEITRQTAMEQKVVLVDLEKTFQGRDLRELFNDPSRDVIHPNPEGYRIMAEEIARTLARIDR